MAKKKAVLDSTLPTPSLIVPIAAIGASAGGQEAVVELLTHLSPTTGLAFVYIQHLDPNHDSRLVDILARATDMPVLEAQHLMRIHPNHLYIIPPDRDLEVLDGVLTLVPREPRPAIHMPIDQFFLSLAERQKQGAIAVVLSGTASDGTLGLRAIKSAGGITFAQDETARFQSMPRSAIMEGVVDRVLPPVEIAREIERLSGQVAIFGQTTQTEDPEAEEAPETTDESTTDSNEDLRSIIQLLRRAANVDFSHYKMTTIRRRIIRRTLLYKLDSLHDYAEYLRQHPEEASLLYDDLLINVTTFFRDTETMDYIQKVLLPLILRDKPAQDPIRIWVPACSTGQEAYSLAMMLLEVLGDRALSRTIQVFATDLSESAVAKARLGSYTRGEVMDVAPGRLQRFFTKVDDHYRINKAVRDLCVFAPHNLLKDPPFSRLDLVSCRNLLIYLDSTLQRKAIVTFHYALNPSGYLVLGRSESVGNSAPLFASMEKIYKVFSRKNDVDSRATFTLTPRHADSAQGPNRPSATPGTNGQARTGTPDRTPATGGGLLPDLDKVVDSLLLNQYVPASVVVNQDLEILQFRGSTGLFLEPSPGKASLNLIKMARPSLVFELRNVVHKAQKLGEPVRKNGLEVKIQGKVHYVAIEAIPLDTATEERLYLIVFTEIEAPIVPVTRSTDARNRRIKELEIELANLREDMRSIIEEQESSNEELQSANEEIISSNEELQSINEELETSKEEIESTNEELLTINQELQVRNDQLSEAYQFAEDIFGTIREATLVLDTDLRVKSANPAFYNLFKLSEETVERRLIYELAHRQWDIPELRLMLTDIITSDAQFQGFELTYSSPDVGEKILSLNARRVVRQHESILLAIEDITEHRRAQRLLAEREAWFHQIADYAPTLIWVTDAKGQFTFLNKVWLEFTGRSLDDVLAHGLATGLHSDDQPTYQQRYDAHIRSREPFSAEYRLRRHDGHYRWMLENAQPMLGADGAFSGYIGSSVDVHLQKETTQELDRLVRERTEALTEANAIMRIALNASNAGIMHWDWCSNATVWDDRGQEIIGFTSDEELTRIDGWLNRIHPDDRERVMLQAQESMETEQDFWIEYRVIHDDGSVHYVVNSGRSIKDQEGKPLNSNGLVMDITNQKKIQEKIQETTDRLQSVFDAVPAMVSLLEAIHDEHDQPVDFVISGVNQSTADFQGQTPEQLRNKLVTALPPDRFPANLLDQYRSVYRTGKLLIQEYFYNPPISEWYATYVMRQVDGKGVVAVALDITERKEAELLLHSTAMNLQAVLNSSPAAIGFLKPIRDPESKDVIDFRLVVCNEGFAQIAGRTQDQIAGLLASQLTDTLWQAHTIEIIRGVMETGKPFVDERHDAATDEWMTITLLKYDEGVVLTGQDRTALKKAEQQQEHWLDELEKSNENIEVLKTLRQHIRERGEFLRSTSHDLRGNFGIIQGAATLLDMATSDEERAQMLDMLQRNLRQATHMLTELLDVARLEAGQEKRQITHFDAAELLGGMVESVQPLADTRGLWLRWEGDENLVVEGDMVKVRRIGQNLLLNAIKYTKTGGVTVIWKAATADHWHLTIADTGPGLPTGVGGHSHHSGEGIGLLITKELCDLLDCRMDVDSQPGVGTRFVLTFPRTYPA